MNNIFCILFILLISFNSNSIAQEITGDWNGLLELQGIKLRLVLHVNSQGDSLVATLDSPDQGANGMAVEKVFFDVNNFEMSISRLMLTYTANLNASGDTLKGTFSQGGIRIPLNMARESIAEPEYNRPQEPKPPFPYAIEDIFFRNEEAGIKLAGTLTMPAQGERFPAVIMISGSGPQDRNEELLQHKPFLVIADYFTRNGIAVLRFDDRGVAESEGDFSKATSADFSSDVSAAVDYLKGRKEIDQSKIGLVGHSEGGLIAPFVASQRNDLSFIILMAGPGVNGKEILIDQTTLISRTQGVAEEDIERNLNILRNSFSILELEPDLEKADSVLRVMMHSEFQKLSEEAKEQIGDLDRVIDAQVSQLNSPWFRYFLEYNPNSSLEKVNCPVLAINGSLDLQVPSKRNLDAIKSSLEKAGNKNFEIIEFPNLNHLFQTTDTGSPSEYATIEETFSLEVLQHMCDWILKIVN